MKRGPLTQDDTSASRRPPAAAGQPRLLADRYEVIAIVGEGASAITWRGHDRRLDRQVAIKILRREDGRDDGWSQRFEREARTSAAISHANVVHIYDVGQQDGWLYLVMQYIEGEDLKALIRRRGRLGIDEAVGYTRQILNGLAAIHRAGILHRDIKPQNVLIDRDGVARVTDFGIAQATIDEGLTTAGTTVGTAAYMAPEQAQAGALSEATDLYAVGVVLYEMLTGTLPYDRPTAIATMLAHIQETPEPPSRRAPEAGIPARLDGIVMQAMAGEPADRFRSATAILRAFDAADPGVTTRVTAAVPSSRTRVAPAVVPRDRARPATARPATRPAAPAAASPARNGGTGFLNAVLVLIFLAMAVVAAYIVYELTRDEDTPNDPVPTATSPVEQVIPEPTDEPVIVPPTDESEPTVNPTEEPAPEPTLEPTQVPIEQAPTEAEDAPAQIIEPDSTPP